MEPSNTENQLTATEVGAVVQTGVVNGDVHVYGDSEALRAAYDELRKVQHQLIQSMRAEHTITQVVWILQSMHARLMSGQREQLARTEAQLTRAEQERDQAIHLVQVARQRIRTLSSLVTAPFPELDVASTEVAMDQVDDYLNRQAVELAAISHELEACRQLSADKRVLYLLPQVPVSLYDFDAFYARILVPAAEEAGTTPSRLPECRNDNERIDQLWHAFSDTDVIVMDVSHGREQAAARTLATVLKKPLLVLGQDDWFAVYVEGKRWLATYSDRDDDLLKLRKELTAELVRLQLPT